MVLRYIRSADENPDEELHEIQQAVLEEQVILARKFKFFMISFFSFWFQSNFVCNFMKFNEQKEEANFFFFFFFFFFYAILFDLSETQVAYLARKFTCLGNCLLSFLFSGSLKGSRIYFSHQKSFHFRYHQKSHYFRLPITMFSTTLW